MEKERISNATTTLVLKRGRAGQGKRNLGRTWRNRITHIYLSGFTGYKKNRNNNKVKANQINQSINLNATSINV